MIAKGEITITSLYRGTWPQTMAWTYVVDENVRVRQLEHSIFDSAWRLTYLIVNE